MTTAPESPSHDRIGPRLGPVRIFGDLDALWKAVAEACPGRTPTLRVFPRGGLSYCPMKS